MANIPHKSKDATEEALTAIQEALSLRQQGEAPPVTADLFPDEQPDRSAPRRAANDDRASIGAILQALHRKPARLPDVIAGIASAVWVAGGLTGALLFRPDCRAPLPVRAPALPPSPPLPPRSPCRSSSSSCSPTCSAARRSCGWSPNPWPRWRCGWRSRKRSRASRS